MISLEMKPECIARDQRQQESTLQNPYAPPEFKTNASIATEHAAEKPLKPIIPAVIGLFTYGSSSPYALVLCVEMYLRRKVHPVAISTHIAAFLSLLGTIVWSALNILMAPDAFNWMIGRPASMYAQIGFMMWTATLVFFLWLTWRINRFHRIQSRIQ